MEWNMTLHPEELRLGRFIRELILEFGTTVEDVEGRLGWEAERLSILLTGQRGWMLQEVFEVLSTLEMAPGDFFGRIYGLETGPIMLSLADRRFEESQEVIQKAVARRFNWKRECTDT
jgi:hypothetical protein